MHCKPPTSDFTILNPALLLRQLARFAGVELLHRSFRGAASSQTAYILKLIELILKSTGPSLGQSSSVYSQILCVVLTSFPLNPVNWHNDEMPGPFKDTWDAWKSPPV